MLKIKKILLSSNTNFFLKQPCFLLFNSVSCNVVNQKKVSIFYFSFKSLSLFKNLNVNSLKFPLQVSLPNSNNLRTFLLNKIIINIRFFNFLFDDFNVFLFLNRSSYFIYFYFVQLIANFYIFLKLNYVANKQTII